MLNGITTIIINHLGTRLLTSVMFLALRATPGRDLKKNKHLPVRPS